MYMYLYIIVNVAALRNYTLVNLNGVERIGFCGVNYKCVDGGLEIGRFRDRIRTRLKSSEDSVWNRVPFWRFLSNKLFKTKCDGINRKSVGLNEKCTINVITPPPNLTGELHIGNLLNLVCIDVYKNVMTQRGCKVNVNFSNDHAGLSFQRLFDREFYGKCGERWLLKGFSFDRGDDVDLKRDLGLKVCERVKRGHLDDLNTLGINWEYGNFTLDDRVQNLTRDVIHKFDAMGLIKEDFWPTYANYYVDKVEPISAAEIFERSEDKMSYYINVKVGTVGDKELKVFTTMPEFYYATCAVGVCADDFQRLGETMVLLPNFDKTVPIIPIKRVDFGNWNENESEIRGFLIMPGYDFSHHIIAKAHYIKAVNVLNLDGKMINVPERLVGKDLDCAFQDSMGFFKPGEKVQVKVPVNLFDEGKRVIITPTKQLILETKKLSEKALKCLERVKVYPESRRKMVQDVLENRVDWCITRNAWWGIKPPNTSAHTLQDKSNTVKHCDTVNESEFSRGENRVLDTWFTSSLWPLVLDKVRSDKSDKTVLLTCYDILQTWVAKMLLVCSSVDESSLFDEVYLHGMVPDDKGKKMSKSHHNTVTLKQLMDDIDVKLDCFNKSHFATSDQDFETMIKANLVRLNLCRMCTFTDFTNSSSIQWPFYILNKFYQIINFYHSTNTNSIQYNTVDLDQQYKAVDIDEIDEELDKVEFEMVNRVEQFDFAKASMALRTYITVFSKHLVPLIRHEIRCNTHELSHFKPYFTTLSQLLHAFTPTFVNNLQITPV